MTRPCGPAARGYAGVPGAQVHYRTQGGGAPLVLLSPVPRSGSYFRALAAELCDLTTIGVDTPGFGLSDPLVTGFSMADVAARVVTVLDHLGIARAYVLGVHTGNKIGAALAAAHPGRVAGFVFAGMTHSIVLDNAARTASMRGYYSSPDAIPGREMVSPARRAEQRWRHLWAVIDRLRHEAGQPEDPGSSLATRARVRDHSIDELAGLEAFDDLYAANLRFDLAEALRAISAPTLIAEFVVPAEARLGRQAPLIASVMRAAGAVSLEGSDQELVERHPGQLAAAVRRFIGQLEHAGAGAASGMASASTMGGSR